MKRIQSRSAWVLLGLAVLTALNVGYRWFRDRIDEPPPPWEFPIGDPFPSAPFRPLTTASATEAAKPLPTSCRMMVIFDPRCPHCETAKALEAAIADSIRLPVVWVATVDDTASARFARDVSPTSLVRYASKSDLSALTVRASPIAFLVSSTGRVNLIFPYEGSEQQHRAVRPRCSLSATS